MSKKKLDLTILVSFIILGIVYIFSALTLEPVQEGEVSSGFFPIILAVFLIGLCFVSIVKCLKSKDEIIEFSGLKRIGVTTGITVVYILAWQFIGYFYFMTFLLLFVLMTLYRLPLGKKKSIFVTNFLVSFGLVAFIFAVFNQLMYIDF